VEPPAEVRGVWGAGVLLGDAARGRDMAHEHDGRMKGESMSEQGESPNAELIARLERRKFDQTAKAAARVIRDLERELARYRPESVPPLSGIPVYAWPGPKG
jgi:hypothetical protein